MSDKQYLFVCGCPRSGTSATGHFLTRSRELVLGMERFALRFLNEGLTPALFERERFFTQMEGDATYELYGFEFMHENPGAYLTRARKWFDTARFVGDKIPELYLKFDQIAAQFPGAKVVMCLRDPFEVASSYKARHENPADTLWSYGSVTEAIRHWNEALRALENAPSSLSIHLHSYRQFFFANSGADQLLAFLGLENTDEMKRAYAELCAMSREQRRPSGLTPAEHREVRENADFARLRRVTSWENRWRYEAGARENLGACV